MSMIRNPRSRRGVTLVEAMVMMTAVAAMLGTVALMLGLTMRLQDESLAAFGRSEALDRLAVRFRQDVHAARSAAIDGRTLRLGPEAGRSVEYRVSEAGDLSRVVVAGGKDAAREPFRIPQSVGAKLDIRDVEGRRFAFVAVELQAHAGRIDPARTVEVAAMVGRGVPPTPKSEGGRP
ncbi:MAG: hypothetical protein BGO49_11885 [Planctomycetales bacterium 71-10]|nr:MAG: hypothetical protein BGO49_11885 [Planctomycetales bacterium 71-10]